MMKVAAKETTTNNDATTTTRARVAAGTVRLTELEGQGVLIPGGYVATAAHCVPYELDGRMALDETFVAVATADGRTFRMAVLAVEPVGDVAILGPADSMVLPKDADAFEQFAESTPPVFVSTNDMRTGERTSASVLTHTREWIEGDVMRLDHEIDASGTAWFDPGSAPRIRPGTSGGPVVDERGHLLGVVSQGDESDDPGAVLFPRLRMSIPLWLWARIERAQEDAGDAEKPMGNADSDSERRKQEARERREAFQKVHAMYIADEKLVDEKLEKLANADSERRREEARERREDLQKAHARWLKTE